MELTTAEAGLHDDGDDVASQRAHLQLANTLIATLSSNGISLDDFCLRHQKVSRQSENE